MRQSVAGTDRSGSLSPPQASQSLSGSSSIGSVSIINDRSPSYLGRFYTSAIVVSSLPFLYHNFVKRSLDCIPTTSSVFCLLMTLVVSSTSLCFAYQNVGISKYLSLSTATHYQPSRKSTSISLAEHEDKVELAAVFYAMSTINLAYIFLFLVSMWIPFSCLSPKWNCVLSTLIPSFTVSFIARSA